MALRLHVPTRAEFGIRQRWLADPEMMSYNAGMVIDHPGYDPVTGCISWQPSEWDAFESRLALPASRQGYFYVEDVGTGYVGHAHYRVDESASAHIGINVVPARRGSGLGAQFLRLLCDRVRAVSDAREVVNEFEDSRVAACRTHLRCGFVPDAALTESGTRIWRSPVGVDMDVVNTHRPRTSVTASRGS